MSVESAERRGAARVDSRWWYWAVAVPAVAALWAASALWLAGVVLVVPGASAASTGAVVSIPAVALGVPALVAFLVLPFALLVDARAVRDAGADWPEDPARPAALAAAADAAILAGVVLFFEVFDPNVDEVPPIEPFSATNPEHVLVALLILTGVVGGSIVCVRYLRERREHVAMPGSLREWREELRAA